MASYIHLKNKNSKSGFLWLMVWFMCISTVIAQTGNFVPSGAEAVNYATINLATPGGQTWATARTATPGYFAAVGTATYTGATDAVNVNGYVKYYATASPASSFDYPIGTGTDLRTLSISSIPASINIGSAWMLGDPTTTPDPTDAATHSTTALGSGVLAVSNVGQWDWVVGGSVSPTGIQVTVSIPDLSAFALATDLRLVGWDGTQWVNLSGSTGASGNTKNSTLSGTMIAGITAIGIGKASVACTTTAPTLSSTSGSNTCPASTVALPSISNATPSGYTVEWYNNSAGTGSPVSSPVSASGSYYAFFVNSAISCKSPASGAFTATINVCCTTSAPTLSSTSGSNTCPASTVALPSISNATPSDYTVEWYNNSAGTGSPVSSPVSASGSYYAFFVNSAISCKSPASGAFTATVNVCCTTTAPTLSSTSGSNTCPASTVALPSISNATPSDYTVEWYNNSAGTGSPVSSPVSASGSYYAFFVNSAISCKSPASGAFTANISLCCVGGNHVFSGFEADNFGTIDLATPSCATWSTDRLLLPGFFSAYGAGNYTSPSDAYNVDGYVKYYATGTPASSFSFPVGTGTDLRSVNISSIPANTEIATAWILGDPATTTDPTDAATHSTTALGSGVLAVSNVGLWDWLVNGTPATGTQVTVSIPDVSGFALATDLRLVGWNGTQWVNLSGSTGASGNTENSTLSGTMIAGITAIGIGKAVVCPTVATPTLSTTSISSTCPTTTVDISTLVTGLAPSGYSLQFYDNNAGSGLALLNPSLLGSSGTYYAVYRNLSNGCASSFSLGITVNITSPCSLVCNSGNVAPQLVKK